MYATIQLSPYVHLQGEVVRRLSTGEVAVRLDGRDYVGRPMAGPRTIKPAVVADHHA